MTQSHKTKGISTETDLKIGENIKTIRLFRDMSQAQLGTRIGVTFQQIQKYECGTNRVAGGRFIDMAEALNVPVTALFEGFVDYEGTPLPHVNKRQLRILNALIRLDDENMERLILASLQRASRE